MHPTKEGELEYDIEVKDLSETDGRVLSEAVRFVIEEFGKSLDIRRLSRVIVTGNFAGALTELSNQLGQGQTITFTQEEYAHAGAKMVFLPARDEFEIVLVIGKELAREICQDETLNLEEEAVLTFRHHLHHEFCHIHDTNKKVDALSLKDLKRPPQGKEIVTVPFAEACWSEYIADYLASTTVTETALRGIAELFYGALNQTKTIVDREILSYRYHANLTKLMDSFRRHGEWLPKVSAYLLGYVHGGNYPSLSALSPDLAERLSGSWFEGTWNEMSQALAVMRESYPEWKGLEVYNPLKAVLERYYGICGLILSTMNEGYYVSIPFTPETTDAN